MLKSLKQTSRPPKFSDDNKTNYEIMRIALRILSNDYADPPHSEGYLSKEVQFALWLATREVKKNGVKTRRAG